MLFSERREAILRAIGRYGVVRVTEMASELAVSQMTVRRDINLLAQEGLVRRVHGGATSAPAVQGPPTPFTQGNAPDLLIGMVVPAASHYHRQVIQGARAAADAFGARLSLGVSFYDPEEDRTQAERLLESGVDGLLLTPSVPLPGAVDALRWLERLSVPVAVVERRRDHRVGLDTADFVTSDHEQGTVSAVRHLADLGHRRIALLSCSTPTTQWLERGLDAACEIFGLARDVPRVVDHVPGDGIGLRAFLDEAVAAGVTAVVAHPDEQAVLLAETARGRGLSIPRDLAVVAYDDDVAGMVNLPLTAVAPPRHAVGRTAAGLLVQRLRERAVARVPQQILLSPRVNVRASTVG